MKKRIIYYALIIISIFTISGCNINDKKYNETNNSNEVIRTVEVTINDKEYTINLENNETAREFLNHLPLELNMSELNGNEKYVYIDFTLPTNATKPKQISAGDVMLYGNNCLVIFYETFNTQYNYTKIGHIDNLSNLGNSSISVKFINN